MADVKYIPCPFKVVMIVGEDYKGWSNVIHANSQIPLGMANPTMTRGMRALIECWNEAHGMPKDHNIVELPTYGK